MKATQISIVLLGHNVHQLETHKWALLSLGYRVLPIMQLADLDRVPAAPAVDLLVLCPSLSSKECAHAVAAASSRWPEVKTLALVRDSSKRPSKLLGHVRQTLDAPGRLLTTVRELVGYARSSTFSHTY
jgi:hypothetical protein